jgi:hypothetical protein
MAIEFPNSPNIGDLFVSSGVRYQWDGKSWVSGAIDQSILNGGIVNGSLTVTGTITTQGVPVITSSTLPFTGLEGLRVIRSAPLEIVITAGRATASDISGNRTVLARTTSITKKLASPFSEGDNGNGILSGAVTDGTYHIYLIGNASGTTSDITFSRSLTPSLPAGFTHYRRIGSIIVVSNAIPNFNQHGKYYEYTSLVRGLNNYAIPTAGELIAMPVPTGIKVNVRGILGVGLPYPGYYISILLLSADQTPYAPTEQMYGYDFDTSVTTYYGAYADSNAHELTRTTDTSGRLYFRRSTNSAYYSTAYQSTFRVFGYEDFSV